MLSEVQEKREMLEGTFGIEVLGYESCDERGGRRSLLGGL